MKVTYAPNEEAPNSATLRFEKKDRLEGVIFVIDYVMKRCPGRRFRPVFRIGGRPVGPHYFRAFVDLAREQALAGRRKLPLSIVLNWRWSSHRKLLGVLKDDPVIKELLGVRSGSDR